MAIAKSGSQRIAFVVSALTGEELKFGKRDATSMYNLLTDQRYGMCSISNSKLILDCQSRSKFTEELLSTFESWNTSTQLILYFSGHGNVKNNQYSLDMGNNKLPFKNIISDLEANSVSRAILILDTCHSGAAIDGVKSSNDDFASVISQNDIPQGIAIIASSKASQRSYESEENSSSIFTYLLCEGIKSGLDNKPTSNGFITVSDIIAYINNKLANDSNYSNFYQRSIFSINKAEQEIWITKNPSGSYSQNNQEFKKTISSEEDLKFLYQITEPKRHPCLRANIDELSLELLRNYSNAVEPNLYDSITLEEILEKLKLYSHIVHGGKKYLHKPAVLCFHRRPESIYEQAKAVFVVGRPRDPGFLREEICGPLSHQVQELVQRVKKYTNRLSYIADDGTRQDIADIDLPVARELISNAIAHRDYEAEGTVIVTVTSEAIEVRNPGRFPENASWDDLIKSSGSVSSPVDAAITQYLSRLLVFEGIGRGFDIFREYIEKYGTDSITFHQLPGATICIRVLHRSNTPEKTSESWQGINFKAGTIGNSTFWLQSPERERVKLTSPKYIPQTGVSNFVGRQNQLAILAQNLQQHNKVIICAIAGMGGIGKTELAIHYAQQHETDYSGGICWLNAREDSLAMQIIQFAQLYMNLEIPRELGGRLLNPEEQVRWCWQNWQPPEGLVLLVLDDVTDFRSCQKLLPTTNRFRVLMTTRLRNLDSNIQEILLDVLSLEEACQLLTGLVGEKRVQRELETAEQLCQWLGYLPLGLELVGRYLAKKPPHWTLAKMLERLKAQRLADEAINHQQQLQQTFSTSQRGVLAAFELSWCELGEITQRVGELLSLFAPDIFAWEWVESTTTLLKWKIDDVGKAPEQLYERHLIQYVEDTEGCYKIHPLIREFLKVKLAASEQADNIKHAFTETFIEIAENIPESPTQDLIQSVKKAVPHLAELAQNLTDAISDKKLIWAFVGLGRFYQGQGLYALAEPWYEECVSAVESRLGEEHPDFATSLNNLAALYESQGRYTEAEPLYQQALALRRRLLGEEHHYIVQSLNNLALLYYEQGRYAEAEPLYQHALELIRRLLGEEHPYVAQSLNNLALLYRSQGRYAEAEPLYQHTLELYKRLLGEEHPDVAQNLNNLALLYRFQGRYAEAEPLYQHALELYTHLLGEEHPDVAQNLNNLALLYYDQGRYPEAETLFQQALELRQRLLGEEHPDVSISLNNLAALYESQGRYTEAEPLYLKALELRQRLLGEEHPDVAISLNNLATLYKSQGRYAEAEPLYQQALALRRRLLGEEHPYVATSLNNLATLYESQGRYAEAEPLYQHALELGRRLLGEEHPDIATSLNNLAALYESQGRYTEAEPLYQQALELIRRLLGEEHPYFAQSLNNLALLYYNQKHYAEAESLYQQALTIYRDLLGEEHPYFAQSLNNLALLYYNQERYTEAEPLFQLALELRQRLLGGGHPDVITSLNNLAELYNNQGRYTEAEKLYQQALEITERSLGVDHPSTATIRENLKSLRDNYA